MKLGGITWWRFNYGSILQAYALQNKLNNYPNIEYEIICQYGSQVISRKNLVDKLQRIGLKKTLKRIICKFGLKKLRSRNSRTQNFINSHLKISEREYSQETISEANDVYDGFICGSDQIWNPSLGPVDSIYWLNFAHLGKLKVAYAPSIGVNTFSDSEKSIIFDNLKSYTAISSRESRGSRLINEVLGEDKCVTVLDPTLMVNRSLWDNLSDAGNDYGAYIFVYLLRGTKQQRKSIELFAQKKNLKIVTMPFLDPDHIELYDFKFGDIKLWDSDPKEFIQSIRYARYVFTDSFHCSVYCCLYHRNFFVFPKIGKAQSNRLEELLNMFQIKNRLFSTPPSDAAYDLVELTDWDTVDRILSEKQGCSNKFLDDIFLNI